MLKYLVLAAALLAGVASVAPAHAYYCQTSCQTILGQTYCQTNCF